MSPTDHAGAGARSFLFLLGSTRTAGNTEALATPRGRPTFKARMRGRTMWAITAISEEDPAKADPLLGALKLTADYMGTHWGGELVGYGSRPDDVLADASALAKAKDFFSR